MTLEEARKILQSMTENMETSTDDVHKAAEKAQEAIYVMLKDKLTTFDIVNGRFVPNQPLFKRIQAIEREMYSILGEFYDPAIVDYLKSYDFVDETNKTLHAGYNDIKIVPDDIKNIRQTVYRQAEFYLTDAVAEAYVQPAKFLLMQTVTNGRTIKQAQSMLKNWNEGQLVTGKLASSVPAPRLQAYAVQVATDSLFQYSGTLQDNIAQKYDLKRFIYIGDIIRDSRPACRHFVSLRRKIDIDEVPPVLVKYPDGVIPGTTKENFYTYRCGFRCRHTAMPVR